MANEYIDDAEKLSTSIVESANVFLDGATQIENILYSDVVVPAVFGTVKAIIKDEQLKAKVDKVESTTTKLIDGTFTIRRSILRAGTDFVNKGIIGGISQGARIIDDSIHSKEQ